MITIFYAFVMIMIHIESNCIKIEIYWKGIVSCMTVKITLPVAVTYFWWCSFASVKNNKSLVGIYNDRSILGKQIIILCQNVTFKNGY